ncbi:hypothetical protein [Micromonospora sp. NPDC005161]
MTVTRFPTADHFASYAGTSPLVLQPGLLTLAELWLGAVWERGQPPSIMDGCVD